MPLTIEQFKAAVEEEIDNVRGDQRASFEDAQNNAVYYFNEAELKDLAHRIISLTADMFVGEKIETSDLAQNEQEQKNLKMYEAGRNIRIEEEHALAEELKSIK